MWHSSPSPKYARTSPGHWFASASRSRWLCTLVHRPAQVLQHGVRLGQTLAVGALALDEVRHGVEPHPVDAHVEPEPHDLGHGARHARVVEVQVGLVAEEAVPVVGLGHRVPRPVGRLGVGEDDARLLVAARVVAPHVEVALGRTGRRAARGLKPRMLIGGVVDDQFGDHLQVGVVGRAQERAEILEGAVARMHAFVVRDVVPVVAQRRGVERQQPDARHAQVADVGELAGQAREVADAIAGAVAECPHVHLVDDGVLVPERIGGGHAATLLNSRLCVCKHGRVPAPRRYTLPERHCATEEPC